MTGNELMSPTEAADSIMENQIPCKDCVKGKVELFTSVEICKTCGGTGFISIKPDLPKIEANPENPWGDTFYNNHRPENYID